MKFWLKVFIGLVLGVVVGLGLCYGFGVDVVSEFVEIWVYFFGDVFVWLICMLVVFFIFMIFVVGVIVMGDLKKLGLLGGIVIGMYFIMMWFVVFFGFVMGIVIKFGEGVDYFGVDVLSIEFIEGRLD